MRFELFGYRVDIRSVDEALEELQDMYRDGIKKERSRWEKKASDRANKARQKSSEKSLGKIFKALDDLAISGKVPTEYMIQKYSGVSINTVKKYRAEIQEYLRSK